MVSARRIDLAEEHTIYNQSTVFFDAATNISTLHSRRTASVGPGLALDYDEDERSENSYELRRERESSEMSRNGDHQAVRRGRDPRPPVSRLFAQEARRNMSLDQTNYQRSFVSHNVHGADQPPPSPPYVPSPQFSPQLTPMSSTSQHARLPPVSPQRSLDDLQHDFRSHTESVDHSSVSSHVINRSRSRPSTTSVQSPLEFTPSHLVPSDLRRSLSNRSPNEDPEFELGSSTSHAQPQHYAHVPSYSYSQQSSPSHRRQKSTSSDVNDQHDGTDLARGRKKRGGLGFANALLDAVKDRVRSRSPMIERDGEQWGMMTSMFMTSSSREPSRAASRGEGLGGNRESTPLRGRTRDESEPKDRDKGFMGMAREGDENTEEAKESGGRWKEFRKGVYTYPISFPIPANSPPTLQCENATVSWELKGYAHRPGAFTAKLSAAQEITVVATPGEDDTEDTDSIIVERQWESQMQYMIAVSGKAFRIGGVMPISLVFMPLTKMKIHRLSVILEERVDYWANYRTIAYTEPIMRAVLLSLKLPNKDDGPILPLNSDDPDVFRRSPLYELLEPSSDPSELMSNLMGPGPWNISKDLKIPEEHLHFTNKNKMSNVSVTHTLKIIFRVERGDDEMIDANTGKRKMFDIVVQSPIHMLSSLCNPQYTSLPPYSSVLASAGSALSNTTYLSASSYTPCTSNSDVPSRSVSRVPSIVSGVASDQTRPTHLATNGHSHSSASVSGGSGSGNGGPSTPLPSPPLSRRQSLLATKFERLVTGQESTEGEAPPSYDASVAA